jgi:hypothetical protein
MKTFPLMLTLVLLVPWDSEVGAVEFPTTVTGGVGVALNSATAPYDHNLFQQAGGKMVRQDLYWDQVETVRGQYNFTYLDGTLGELTSRGIHRSGTLCYGNKLYGTDPTKPTWRDGFTKFAAAVAAHYAGRDNIFEIWNEPNGGFTTPNLSDVNQYMALVKSAAPAMRAADPTCKIVGPSLSDLTSGNINWLKRCMDMGLLNYVDAISVHPYRATNPETAVADYATIRNLMRAHGKMVPIVCTEWGYSTGKKSGAFTVSNAQLQADYLARMYLVNASQGIRFTAMYEWKNVGADPNDYEGNFGMLTANGHPQAAYYAMQHLTTALKGTTFSKRFSDGNTADWLLVFKTSDGHEILAAWTTRSGSHDVAVPVWGAVHLTGTPIYVTRDFPLRVWTSASGTRTVKAKFIKVVGETVYLLKEDGSEITIAREKLSEDGWKCIQHEIGGNP